MQIDKDSSRRKFIRQTSLAGAGLMLAGPTQIFPQATNFKNTKSKGYAAKDASGKLVPWNFERRTVGDNDILSLLLWGSIRIIHL